MGFIRMRAILLLLACSPILAAQGIKIVLVAGKPSHGPRQHEFNAGAMLLEKCLRQNQGVATVLIKGGWPEDEGVFAGAGAIVLYEDGGTHHPMIADERLQRLGRLMQKGVGLACLHYAVEVPKDRGGMELLDWIGGYYERPYSQNPINDVPLSQASPNHPVSRGWTSFASKDEWY